MTLPRAHPKISFIRRIVELEIRLAYYERVKTTLPQEIQEKVLGQVEPGPNFTYADESESPIATLMERLISLAM